MIRLLTIFIIAFLFISGCTTVAEKPQTFLKASAMPRSILVIPPANLSVEVNAPYTFLATVSKPLAEKGYYVFPVAVVDRLFKENGVSTTEEMNQIPLDKIRQHTGADAVMLVTIQDWGQKFQLVSSAAVVKAHLRIVDTLDGTLLWEARVSEVQSNQSEAGKEGGLLGAVLVAVVDQISGSLMDATPDLIRTGNNKAIRTIPDGPYVYEAKLYPTK